ncbi:MAG: nitrite reductase small subunit NirD [Candidatus Protistobacter heckmanni]|nr:nitrite reductase small subunit NirD [Candidatus Protistobacter heckmanni]
MMIEKAGWIEVALVEDIPQLGARVIEGGAAGPVALFRAADDHVFALLDSCPHKKGPLSQGIVHGHTVTCPLHAWNIALDNGCAHEPDSGCTRSYAVKVEQGRVSLNLAELADAGE